MPLLATAHLRSDLNLRREPLDDLAAIFVSQFGPSSGGISPLLDSHNLKPPTHIFSVQKIGIQRVDSKLAFCCLGSVTLVAGLLERRLDLCTKRFQIRLGAFVSSGVSENWSVSSKRPYSSARCSIL